MTKKAPVETGAVTLLFKPLNFQTSADEGECY
jgi:hypothetical protein